MLKEVLDKYNKITIFRHENPDCDALGSQFALKYIIEENYPDTIVKVLGEEKYSKAIFPLSDETDDDFIKASAAFVVDTANTARIDDKRYSLAQKIIKIDHHPNLEPFGEINIVSKSHAATSELLYDICLEEDLMINYEAAVMLYRGILTDTLSFKTNNTTSNTLKVASGLIDKGINIPTLNNELFDDDLKTFIFKTKLREKLIVDGNLGYIIFNEEEIKASNKLPGEIRSFVSEIGSITEIKIWAIFTEKTVDGIKLYDGSLRSKKAVLNELAGRYNGGGHPNASGVKNLSNENLNNLIKELKLLLDCETIN